MFFPPFLQVMAADRGTPQEMVGTAVVSHHTLILWLMSCDIM